MIHENTFIELVGRRGQVVEVFWWLTLGKALLFLLPQELGFLMFLKQAKVPLNEYQFPPSKIANVQTQLEKLMEKNYYLNKSGKDGFRSYLQAYASHSLKQIFDVSSLDLTRVAKAYGFTVPPTGKI